MRINHITAKAIHNATASYAVVKDTKGMVIMFSRKTGKAIVRHYEI